MDNNKKENINITRTAITVVGLCLLAILAFKGIEKNPNKIKPVEIVANPLLSEAPIMLKKNPYKDIQVEAKSVYVLDVNQNKTIFELNSEQQLPLASLTKIITAITAKELISEDTIIVFNKEKWKLDDLIQFTLLVSSNDGAYVLGHIKDGFITNMNENVKKLGLSNTYFMNESGLDISKGVSGGYGTAKDVAKMFNYAVSTYPNIFTVTKEKSHSFISLNKISHKGLNTNTIIDDIPEIIASKTGTTDLAGGNLVIEFMPKDNYPVIIVIMGSSTDGRFNDMLTLVKATKKYYTD